MDTGVNKYTYKSALLGVGGCFKGLDLIFGPNPGSDKFFLAARPPGHHAFPSRGSGFCIFNSIALGAKYAQKKHGIEKIAIIDFDAHHGNGTEKIFYSDDNVLFFSLHQHPLYPGTGAIGDIGEGEGVAYNINITLPPGISDDSYLRAINEIAMPVLTEFDPDLIFVSAGYDDIGIGG